MTITYRTVIAIHTPGAAAKRRQPSRHQAVPLPDATDAARRRRQGPTRATGCRRRTADRGEAVSDHPSGRALQRWPIRER